MRNVKTTLSLSIAVTLCTSPFESPGSKKAMTRPSPSRKDQKNPIFPTQMRDLSLRANHKRNKPRHEKNDRRSHSGRQIRIDAVDPYLCKN